MARCLYWVSLVDAEVLHAEASDGGNCPAVLTAMIVQRADLPNVPADRKLTTYALLESSNDRVESPPRALFSNRSMAPGGIKTATRCTV
jgi:hypothetical protein